MKKLFKRVSILFAALMALSVSTVNTAKEVKAAEVVDTLNATFTGAGGSYGDWTGKTGTSGAVYAGNSMKGQNTTIQIRSDKSNSGIVTTTTGGTATKVEVTWNSSTKDGRTLDIYGKNSAYTQAKDLYNTSNKGTKLGSIIKGTSTTLDITGSYSYIGMRSASGAMYISSIDITWATAGAEEPDTPATPAELVEEGLNAVTNSITKKFFEANETVQFATKNENEVVFTYLLSNHDENVYSIDSTGKFTVTPTNSFKSATLTITASLNGETQTANVTFASALENTTLTLAQAVVVANSFEHNNYTSGKYYISGEIKEVYNTEYGNMYINDGTISDNFTVYGTYSADGTTRYDAMTTKPVAGDTVTLYGILGSYNSKPQMKNGWLNDERTNLEKIADCFTDFSLSFDYAITTEEKTTTSDAVENTSSLDFSDVANRLSQDTNSQVWSNNVITLTNEKANSQNDVADYSNPARFYKGSKLTIEAPGAITKIVFNVASKDSTQNFLKDSIGTDVTVNGSVVTFTGKGDSNSLTINLTAGKVFLDSMEVTYTTGGTVTEEVINHQAYANIGITFGANVDAKYFEGYTVTGGVLIANAAKVDTTIAEAYANGSFDGITQPFNGTLTEQDGFYSVGTTIEIIDGALVLGDNDENLNYEFAAAVYFTLTDAEGNATTVVLNQKVYSARSMIEAYAEMDLGAATNKVVDALAAYIA